MKGHKRQRPDRGPDAWELVVHAGNDPVTGRRRNKSRIFRGTKAAADTALAQLVAEVTQERQVASDAPLATLLDRWLEMAGDDLSPTTLRGYRQVIDAQIRPALGLRPIDQITTAELDGFYRKLLKTRKPATVRQTHSILRRAFRQAVRWGWLTSNPAGEASPPSVRRAPLKIPTPEQVTALIAAAEADEKLMGCFYRLAVATGARRGELCGLRWSRVDLEGKAVLIEQSLVQVGRDLVEKDTKTHQARRVGLDARTVSALKAQRKRSLELAMAVGVKPVADPFVFTRAPDGSVPVRPDVVTKTFQRLAKDHAPGTRLHDLRHFSVTRLLAAGVPVKTVSGRHGHGSAAMTLDVYAHFMPASDQDAAELLAGILDG